MSPRSLGVEEEFLLVEPGTGRPQAVAGTILRAARPELEGALLSPRDGKPEPAAAVVAALAEHCREALADTGDAGAVAELLADLVARGNGAAFQREEYRRSGRLPEMISRAVDITVALSGQPAADLPGCPALLLAGGPCGR